MAWFQTDVLDSPAFWNENTTKIAAAITRRVPKKSKRLHEWPIVFRASSLHGQLKMKMAKETNPMGPLKDFISTFSLSRKYVYVLDPEDPSPARILSQDATKDRSKDTRASNHHADQSPNMLH